MNKEDECEIVKDLAVPYVEDLINSKSKTFVENHIEKCESCKKYYANMNLHRLNEIEDEKKKEEYEIDFLKKIRKKVNFLKITITIIVIIIISIISVLFIKYQNTNKIINKAYDKIQNLKNLDNYILIKQTTDISYERNTKLEAVEKCYYKDGKYKIDRDNYIDYYEDDSYSKINVYKDLKQIDYCTQNYIEMKRGKTFYISEIMGYKNDFPGIAGLYRLTLSIRKDRFNGVECYVIRAGNDKSYNDVWIDKNNYTVLKVVNEDYLKFYRETIYTLIENEVTDSDVDSSILETSEYSDYKKNSVTNKATEEIKNSYTMVN